MINTLLPILVAAFIGHQLDEVKMKKYEMTDENDNVVKVQFSKHSDYSCPLSCGLDHHHYAKNIEDADLGNASCWIIESSKGIDGSTNYNINGQSINSYTLIKGSKVPKSAPPVTLMDLND